jgi:hypothetical protein
MNIHNVGIENAIIMGSVNMSGKMFNAGRITDKRETAATAPGILIAFSIISGCIFYFLSNILNIKLQSG